MKPRIILVWGTKSKEVKDNDKPLTIDFSSCTITVKVHKPTLNEHIMRGPRTKDIPEMN